MKKLSFTLGVLIAALLLAWLWHAPARPALPFSTQAAAAVVPQPQPNPAPAQAILPPPPVPAAPIQTPAPVSQPVTLAYPAELAITETDFARFNHWAVRYLNASPAEQADLESEGIALATTRREDLRDLIQRDPARALQLAFPRVQRQSLPESVQTLLETSISARGDLTVLGVTPLPGAEPPTKSVVRTASFGDTRYQAFVYGRLEGVPSLQDYPLNGIALDGLMALNEDPGRPLLADEIALYHTAPNRDAICSISGQAASINNTETLVEVAGEVLPVCGPTHVSRLNDQMRAASGNPNFELNEEGFLKPHSSYTEGTKKLLVLRVDFSDRAGEPFSFTSGSNMVVELNKFYRDMSYGRVGFAPLGRTTTNSAVTSVLRMPQTAAWYGANDPSTLRSDARAAATAAGTNLANFQFDLICFSSVPGYSWGGLGYIGAPGAWVQGGASTGIAAHELGHNFGLLHANFWDTSGLSIIGNGASVEYGDKFDTMGSANAGSKHFNARYKNYLEWLKPAEIKIVSSNGLYRLYPHDDPTITNGVRGVRVTKNSATNYWMEFRSKYTGNKWMPAGIGLRWAGNDGRASLLLDVTPGSIDGKDDSPLLLGRTFSDKGANVHITPVAKGGTALVPYIDVMVNRSVPATNLPPIASLTLGRTNSVVASSVPISVAASDPNGDDLAYFWDFGDGTFGSNSADLTHLWTTAGDYVVQCTISDMKGGSAIVSSVVRVGSPLTLTASGFITDGEQPVANVKVTAGTKVAYTDSNGRYYITGLTSGSYTVKAALEGYVFSAGFTNPVVLGPSRHNLDFIAIRTDTDTNLPLILAGAVWSYKDDGSNQATAWRNVGFNDAEWSAGPSPLGYGDDNEKTPLNFGTDANNKFLTTYFRHRFVVQDKTRILGLTVGLRRDDGGVVYLNGREIFRSNMGTGTITSTTAASGTASGSDEQIFFEADVDPNWLNNGTNVMAVEIHQVNRTSSDIVMDLRLEAITAASLPTPSIRGEIVGSNLKISWPASPLDWSVYASANPAASSAGWIKLNLPVSTEGSSRQVTIPTSEDSKFFRLGR